MAEENILGILLQYSDRIIVQKVLQAIKPTYFYKPSHQIICSAILDLWNTDAPIDLVSVVHRLKQKGELESAEGPLYISKLSKEATNYTSVSHWFQNILYPLFIRREIIRLSYTANRDAYDDTTEIFQLLDKYITELESCKPEMLFKPSHSANKIGEDFIADMGLTEQEDHSQETTLPIKRYPIGCPQFDEIVTVCANKIMLLASHKAGLKSRFSNFLVTTLAEMYDDVACYWVSLEDSRDEQLRIYLSRKLKIIPDKIKFRLFDSVLRPNMAKLVKKWQSFDFVIRDQGVKIKEIETAFKIFCSERPNKLNILIIDNVLSLGDLEDFKRDQNAMYDYIGATILNIKRSTHGLVIPIHHYNDEASQKAELINGYRPRLINLKGTEVWRRISYQNLLINRPSYYKDLMSDYKGDQAEILKYLFIMDVSTNRAHKELDEDSIIRFWAETNYCIFTEIQNDFEYIEPEIDYEPTEKVPFF